MVADLEQWRQQTAADARPFHTANGTLDWKPLDDWSFYVTANYTGQQRAVSARTGKTPVGYTLL